MLVKKKVICVLLINSQSNRVWELGIRGWGKKISDFRMRIADLWSHTQLGTVIKALPP